jgi:hypothetical protein
VSEREDVCVSEREGGRERERERFDNQDLTQGRQAQGTDSRGWERDSIAQKNSKKSNISPTRCQKQVFKKDKKADRQADGR